MVSTPEQETLQLRALKLCTPIKRTFGLSTLTLGFRFCFSAYLFLTKEVGELEMFYAKATHTENAIKWSAEIVPFLELSGNICQALP